MNVLYPQPPFLWPEPLVIEGKATYENNPPFDVLAQTADAVLGIVSALTDSGIAILESWLENNPDLNIALLVCVYPTCPTSQEHLSQLVRTIKQYPDRLEVYIHPFGQVTARATNTLCLFNSDSQSIYFVTGANGILGWDDWTNPSINIINPIDITLLQSFRQYFDWLCGQSRNIMDEGITKIPNLVLPEGTEAGTHLWQAYLKAFEKANQTVSLIDSPLEEDNFPVKEKEKNPSPSEKLGLPKFDSLADQIARLYEKGQQVSIDELSRIPPLDSPVDPKWFGDYSEIQRGSVTRKVSMRVSIIDEKTLKELEKRRKGLRTLLEKFSFSLANNVRWMPTTAKNLFESEIKRLNEEGKKIISDLLKGDVESFLKANRDQLKKDINAMHQALGGSDKVPEEVIDRVVSSLKERLSKAQKGHFMPTLSYSFVRYSPTENDHASPWGQAFSLLADIATFPRKALTDSFFFRGLKVDEDDLLQSMNVAEDTLFNNLNGKGIKTRCKAEIELLSLIKKATLEARDRCELVWDLLDGKPAEAIEKDLRNRDKSE